MKRPCGKAAGAILLFLILCAGVFAYMAWAPGEKKVSAARKMNVSLGRPVVSLDPALAADSSGQRMIAAFYDTPLQYVYSEESPVRLEPSMLVSMPYVSPDMKIYRLTLKKGLLFQKAPCFRNEGERKVKASDLAFSILRLADARIMSGGFWLVRGKIEGIDSFRSRSANCPKGDLSVYDKGCSGLHVVDDLTLEIRLKAPDPRFIYALAMPYFAVVSRRAVEHYGDSFGDFPAGSGPFRLVSWEKDYKIVLERNEDFREEYYKNAVFPGDRKRRLPLLDRIDCYLVRQELASWLMFLQGELDSCAPDGEKFDAIVDASGHLIPALSSRGIRLIAAPLFEINYIGFSFTDPVLAKNEKLRQAISLAFDKDFRVKSSNGRLKPVYSPVPDNIAGALNGQKGRFGCFDPERAAKLLAEAGYPGGIDPATGKALELTYDQSGGDTFFRQNAELFATDLKRIGILLKPAFNNRSRFFQKLRQGQVQMFRLSWTGDYPDAENFFQLFYGPNADSCNRVSYRDKVFDRMYEEIRCMPDSPARTKKYEKMTAYLMERCPWIFESCPMSFLLTHQWLANSIVHDFAFGAWKYLSVDDVQRTRVRKTFRPLNMSELRN